MPSLEKEVGHKRTENHFSVSCVARNMVFLFQPRPCATETIRSTQSYLACRIGHFVPIWPAGVTTFMLHLQPASGCWQIATMRRRSVLRLGSTCAHAKHHSARSMRVFPSLRLGYMRVVV
jgi:hypothetical protein